MSNPNKYIVNVNKIKQLVDLNKHYTNFNLRFKAVSQNQEDFYAAVVDQTTIDNVPDSEIEYKLANGSISGNVSSDKNVYQNHFLLLKSENPTIVEVEVELTELPKTQKQIPQSQRMGQGMGQGMAQGMAQGMPQGGCPIEHNSNGQTKSSFFNRRNLFILLGLFFIGLLVYFFMKSKTQPNKDDTSLIPRLSEESLQRQVYQPHLPKLSLASSASKSSGSIASSASSARSSLSKSSKSSSSEVSSSSSSKMSARSGVNTNLIEKLKSISLG